MIYKKFVCTLPIIGQRLFTNSFLIKNNKILLGLKNRNFGAGLYNGFGGKVEYNESILEAAQREFKEEAGITMIDPVNIGVINFHDNSETRIVHIFRAEKYKGHITSSEEMSPRWFDINDIPFDNMHPDNKLWLNNIFQEKYFSINCEI